MSYLSNAAVIEHIREVESDDKATVFSELRLIRKLAKAQGIDVDIRDWQLALVMHPDMRVRCYVRFGNKAWCLPEDPDATTYMPFTNLESIYANLGTSFLRFCLNCL